MSAQKTVLDYLSYDKKPKAVKISRQTGLQLLSALIYNGFAYYDRATDQISEAVFLDRLLNNLSGPREVYKSASEVSETVPVACCVTPCNRRSASR